MSFKTSRKMKSFNLEWLLLIGILVISILPFSQAFRRKGSKVKTSVYLSPKIELGPGQVANKLYWNVEFPKGHIALKSFNAELVDEVGNSVPLYHTYMHHWLVLRIFVRKGLEKNLTENIDKNDFIFARNSGICNDHTLDHFFGSGSETRKTLTYIPDPYGIEVGNPKEAPRGYVQSWAINVHTIDTRGVEDTMGCIECKCDLYNITKDHFGKGYEGGLKCCSDGSQCRMKEGFNGDKKTLYLRYIVKYVQMDRSVVPVKVYTFDLTDTWKRTSNSTGKNTEHNCLIEYSVAPCPTTGSTYEGCIENKKLSLDMPFSGYLIYGFGHLHTGGIKISVYRENGRILFSSNPIYGDGEEAGNEVGYLVGMSTYYPKPGSVRISRGETLILEANYSNTHPHYGVMAQIYMLIAEELP